MKTFYLFCLGLSFLFTGNLTYGADQAPSEWQVCSACHTIGKGKLVGPDLKGVTERRSETWLISFIRSSQTMIKNGDAEAVKIFEENNKIPMPDNNLSDDQIRGILTYIKNYNPNAATAAETAPEKTVTDSKDAETNLNDFTEAHKKYGPGNNLPVFIIFLVLLIISIIDLAIFKIIKSKFVHIVIILVCVFVLGEITIVEAIHSGRQQGYSPDQPVKFSHKIHVTQNKIDCIYCHSDAYDSKSAGIPGTNLCMNCHNVVRKGPVTGETEIKKIIESWEKGKPIEWIRVHNLPDHVFFSHAQHVNAGKLKCQECHGKVENMEKIMQVNNLGMGWCLDCHRNKDVQFTNNVFYRDYEKFHNEIKEGLRKGVKVAEIGGDNCQACHY